MTGIFIIAAMSLSTCCSAAPASRASATSAFFGLGAYIDLVSQRLRAPTLLPVAGHADPARVARHALRYGAGGLAAG
jgi:hypothetical protein